MQMIYVSLCHPLPLVHDLAVSYSNSPRQEQIFKAELAGLHKVGPPLQLQASQH